ncbi:MAG: hypothetical protein ACFFGZ_10530, partial [Candidatus Thorarchaeota archaeon]
SVLFVLMVWVSFIGYQRPKLQQELQQQLEQLQRQTSQLQESINALGTAESPQELGGTAKKVYQQFTSCKKTIDFTRHRVACKWLPRFLRPDLTSIETLATTVNRTYTQFTQNYLKRVEESLEW